MQEPSSLPTSAYASAGVDIDAGNHAKQLISTSVRTTFRPEVLTEFGGFSGLFALNPLGMRDPVLVTSIDGVGTKLKVAFMLGRHSTVGTDLVAHCVNDILTCGARPLMFLDYLALGDVPPEQAAEVVAGVAAGCREAGCALIGGETAQMPGFYAQGEYDLAGCIIGIIERDAIVSGNQIVAGDVAIGFPSVGLHTNGYSLARKIFEGLDWTIPIPELGESIGDALLRPHISYLVPVQNILNNPELSRAVTGMAHITGGGLLENIPRIIPSGLGVDLDASTWEILPIFNVIQSRGQVSWEEMVRVFNVGVGYILIAHAEQANDLLKALDGSGARIIGSVVPRENGACVQVRGLPK
jgi:phosphoribosylformylglycinamidine cyclo-ligase